MRSHASTLVLPTLILATAVVAACGGYGSKTTGPSKITYVANLQGSNEVPAVTSTGTGSWKATYDPAAKTLSYTLDASGLSAGTTNNGGHIHGPASPTQSTGVIVGFTIAAGQTSGSPLASGTIDLTGRVNPSSPTSITGDSLIKLMDAGLAYVNVHTSAHPAGEIRGQIAKQP